MSETTLPLARNFDGDPFEIPPAVVAWRVKRGGRRGRPRPIFDPATGRQLEVPLSSSIDDLIEAGCPSGRYRLEGVDSEGRALPGIIALCEISDGDEEEDDDSGDHDKLVSSDTVVQLAQLVREAVTANNQALQTLTAFVNNLRPVPQAIHVEIPQMQPAAPAPGSPEQWIQALTPIVAPILQMLASAKAAGPVTP